MLIVRDPDLIESATNLFCALTFKTLQAGIETYSPHWGCGKASITVSIGVSEIVNADTDFNQTLKRADQAVDLANS